MLNFLLVATLGALALMQNLSADDQERLADGLAVLEKATMGDEEKALVLGLELMNHVGPGVLRAAVDSLGPRIRNLPQIELVRSDRLDE